MNKNIFEIVTDTLLKLKKYVSEDRKLLKASVYEDIINMDKDLLFVLISNPKIKEKFFQEVNGTLVFDKQKFAWFIESKEFLANSYTRYINKIGLTKNEEFISKSNDVVLNFPYKDCVLQGGQNKEDQKSNEIFHNEIIASDEITRMLNPKILTNAKRYTKNGIEKNIIFNDNDNLIIKGNNLIVLSSLLKRYGEKIKCIYIDPPYNTGSDSFKYNDKFNHSAWLTFMKNRLELAKKLLSNDGFIFVQIDDNEQAYLKVLMDEIFGREKFIGTIVYRRRKSQANLSKNLSIIHEYILIYKKSELATLNNILNNTDSKDYKNPDNDIRGAYKTMPCTNKGGSLYTITSPNGKKITDEWRFKEETFYELLNDNRIVFPKKGEGKPRYKLFLSEKNLKGVIVNSWWDDVATNQDANKDLKELFGKNVFDYPKSEDLIKKIIEISTKENDTVLDYHLGSGTTCAVAHKMGRRYIGIEQMNYVEDISVKRLSKVIEGEQTGISKALNWKGGGSFVYCELLKNANLIINKINLATENNILEVKEEVCSDERIIPYVTREELKKADENFRCLSLEEKKMALINIVDKNKLYVNYSDVEDETFEITENDKKFSESFYKI